MTVIDEPRPKTRKEDIKHPTVPANFPKYYEPYLDPAPFKVLYGGRGAGKSHSVAAHYVLEAAFSKHRYLCAREFQSSMKDSVIKLLADKIYELGLQRYFDIKKDSIHSTAGSEFMFKGLKRDPQSVRSTEGVDRCWVEEAHVVSDESWNVLLPTLFRAPGCELIVTLNPDLEEDPTYKRFVLEPPRGALVTKVNWSDNEWFPQGQDFLRKHMLETDPEAYAWIWQGEPRKLSDAIIFRNRVFVEEFDTPTWETRFYFGADWGFAADPSVLVRCFIHENVLYIDREAYGYGVEMDDLPAMYDLVFEGTPGGRNWPIGADNARPETISYMKRHGFPRIFAAEKWAGSVEDGVSFLKQFKKIVVHPRCKNIAEEFRLYSNKKEPKTGRVLPQIVDRWNHGIDALRYALVDLIRQGDGYFEVTDDVLLKVAQTRF